jgi:ribonuclease HI
MKSQNDRKHGKKAIHVKKAIDWAMNLVMVVEVEACKRGLQLAKDMGVRRIAIETDSNLVADMWQSRSTNMSEIKPILCDIESRSLGFFSFSLDHVNREANLVTHACAKEASSGFHKNFRMNVIPNFLAGIVHDDCILVNDE